MNGRTAVLLAFTMALVLCACGRSNSSSDAGLNSSTISDSTEKVEIKESNVMRESLPQESSDSMTETMRNGSSYSNDTSYENTVLVENEECSITIASIEPDGVEGFTINAVLENKSSEKTYEFSVSDGYVNGLYARPFFSETVEAGEIKEGIIAYPGDSLSSMGITNFTDIELAFRVYEDGNWEEDPVVEDSFHIYPYGKDKVKYYIRDLEDTDTVLVDNDDISVIVIGYSEKDNWGYIVNLYLVNKTDKSLMFKTDDVYINGHLDHPAYYHKLTANNCAYSSFTLSDMTLDSYNIKSVDEIKVELSVYEVDENYREGKEYLNETFVLTP